MQCLQSPHAHVVTEVYARDIPKGSGFLTSVVGIPTFLLPTFCVVLVQEWLCLHRSDLCFFLRPFSQSSNFLHGFLPTGVDLVMSSSNSVQCSSQMAFILQKFLLMFTRWRNDDCGPHQVGGQAHSRPHTNHVMGSHSYKDSWILKLFFFFFKRWSLCAIPPFNPIQQKSREWSQNHVLNTSPSQVLWRN